MNKMGDHDDHKKGCLEAAEALVTAVLIGKEKASGSSGARQREHQDLNGITSKPRSTSSARTCSRTNAWPQFKNAVAKRYVSFNRFKTRASSKSTSSSGSAARTDAVKEPRIVGVNTTASAAINTRRRGSWMRPATFPMSSYPKWSRAGEKRGKRGRKGGGGKRKKEKKKGEVNSFFYIDRKRSILAGIGERISASFVGASDGARVRRLCVSSARYVPGFAAE